MLLRYTARNLKTTVRADLLAPLEEIMKRTVVLCAAALLLVASGIYAFGDIARPKVSPQPKVGKTVLYTSLSIVPSSSLSEARLQISRDTLRSIAREASKNS